MANRNFMPILENEEWLEYQYRVKGATMSELASKLGRAECSVRSRLKEHGIPIRSRGAKGGEEHPRWNGGSKKRQGSWQTQRKRALERDEYTCQGCGMDNATHKERFDQSLHVHHITPYGDFDGPEEANDLNNLIVYCRGCHWNAERQ